MKCWRLTVLLRREGWHVNAKRIYRLYREEGLISSQDFGLCSPRERLVSFVAQK